MEQNGLPKGWVEVDLQDVAEVLDKYRKPINSSERDSRIAGKSQSELFPYYGATGQVGYIDDYLLDGEYVLLGEDGAPFLEPFKNKAYLVSGKVWINNHAHILKSYTSNKFLCYYLNQINYNDLVSGTTRLKLTQAAMNKIPVPVPPLPEQHQIVAKIEELFSELDNGVAQLQALLSQLKTYRQSVLKYAFEGKLTEQWRKENPAEPAARLLEQIRTERQVRYEAELAEWKAAKTRGEQGSKPSPPKEFPLLTEEEVQGLPKLPEGWMWVNLGEFINSISAGKSFSCEERPPKEGEVGVAKVSAVTWGTYDELESKTCIDQSMINPSYLIKEGDFLFSRANTIELVGACVIARRVTKQVMLSDKTLRFEFLNGKQNQEFYLHYLRSPIGKSEIQRHSTGNQESMRNIGQDRIRQIAIPLCSIHEQHQIVTAIESRLSICEEAEGVIRRALEQAEGLRQSILKKAFEGRLVELLD